MARKSPENHGQTKRSVVTTSPVRAKGSCLFVDVSYKDTC